MTAFDFNAPVADDVQESRLRWQKILDEMEFEDTYTGNLAGMIGPDPTLSPSVNVVKFYNGEGDVALCLNFSTGEVKLSDYMRADEAAQLFWDRVMELNPYPTQEVAVYSPESRTEQLGFFMTSKGEKMAWWETPGDGMDIGDAPVRKLDEPTPHPVEQFEFFTVSLLVDENESNYNRAMKVVK